MAEELFNFADDVEEKKSINKSSWKILVVDDDDKEVHAITRTVLKGFEFDVKISN